MNDIGFFLLIFESWYQSEFFNLLCVNMKLFYAYLTKIVCIILVSSLDNNESLEAQTCVWQR